MESNSSALFSGDVLPLAIQQLSLRRCRLYHSAHWIDFSSYIQLPGLPSRSLLEAKRLPFTPFTSDETDRLNRVWDKIFLNLQDFGAVFHQSGTWTPPVYGPIQFVYSPEALITVQDFCISFVTGGKYGDPNMCVGGTEELNSIFDDSTSDSLKWTQDLAASFPTKTVCNNPELVIHSPSLYLAYEHLEKIVVDPLTIDGAHLPALVAEALNERGHKFNVETRASNRPDTYQALISFIATQDRTIQDLSSFAAPELVRQWMTNELKVKKDSTIRNFIRYYRDGTLTPLLAKSK